MNLTLRKKSVEVIFDLLGDNEDSMTYGLGYCLSLSSQFLIDFCAYINIKIDKGDIESYSIHLQHFEEEDKGYSDIEIWEGEERKVIIEAKRGWEIPSKEQLEKYASRFKNDPQVIALSTCTEDFATRNLDDKYGYISWKRVLGILNQSITSVNGILEKNILFDYKNYLGKIIDMERESSNWVYCVSLSRALVANSKVSFLEVVVKYGLYFYPFGEGGWPTVPPNYMAFRIDGKLLSIHKVEDYKVIDSLNEAISDIPDNGKHPHYLLELGKAFKPENEIKNGKIWPSGKKWCMLDTLFTSETIWDAAEVSKSREQSFIK